MTEAATSVTYKWAYDARLDQSIFKYTLKPIRNTPTATYVVTFYIPINPSSNWGGEVYAEIKNGTSWDDPPTNYTPLSYNDMDATHFNVTVNSVEYTKVYHTPTASPPIVATTSMKLEVYFSFDGDLMANYYNDNMQTTVYLWQNPTDEQTRVTLDFTTEGEIADPIVIQAPYNDANIQLNYMMLVILAFVPIIILANTLRRLSRR